MNAAFLLIPFVLVRFVFMQFLGRDGLQRAAHYAPPKGKERGMAVLYQLCTLLLFGCVFF